MSRPMSGSSKSIWGGDGKAVFPFHVIPGLDPGIHAVSKTSARSFSSYGNGMDCRIKSDNDNTIE